MKATLLLFNFISFSLFSQNKLNHYVNELYTLDTIVNTKIKVNFKDFNESDYITNQYNNKLYIYSPSYVEDDSIKLIIIDLKDYSITNSSFYLKNMSDKIKTPYLKNFAISTNYIAFYFTYENFIVYDITSKIKLIDTVINLPGFCPYEKLNFISNNEILFTKTYNSIHGCGTNIKLSIFNIIEKKFIKNKEFINFNKEFTHFSPNEWISTSYNNNIYLVNSSEYKIFILNQELKITDSIYIKDSNWHRFPATILNTYYKLNKNASPKSLIDFLSPFNDKFSRIERIKCINDSTILVIKIPKNQKLQNYIRHYDFLVYNNNSWKRKYENYIENSSNDSTKYYQYNYPLMSSNSLNNNFLNNFYINLKAGSVDNYFGKSFKELNKESEKNGEKDLFYRVFIYKLKL